MEHHLGSQEQNDSFDRKNLVPRFRKVIASTISAIDPLLDSFMVVVKTLPCAPEEEADIRLALYEALANAIEHGNHNDPHKKVSITCFCECGRSDNLLVVVRDEGPGFDPNRVPDPRSAQMLYSSRGRGIFLMRELLDEVSFRHGGREVEMRKRSARKTR